MDGEHEDRMIISNTPMEGEPKFLQFVKRYIGALGEDVGNYKLANLPNDIEKWKKYIIEVAVVANKDKEKANFPYVNIVKVLSGMAIKENRLEIDPSKDDF